MGVVPRWPTNDGQCSTFRKNFGRCGEKSHKKKQQMNIVYAQLHAGYSNDASKYLVGSSSSQAQKHFNQRFLVQIPDDDFAHFFSIVARMVELCVRTPRRNKLAGKEG
jgi:hypothetical protein